jgi:hypothetical protein
MEDKVHTANRGLKRIMVAQVAPANLDCARREGIDTLTWPDQYANRVTAIHQQVDEMASQKTGRAGDEY